MTLGKRWRGRCWPGVQEVLPLGRGLSRLLGVVAAVDGVVAALEFHRRLGSSARLKGFADRVWRGDGVIFSQNINSGRGATSSMTRPGACSRIGKRIHGHFVAQAGVTGAGA
jgi:hypothetical protein